MSAPSGIRVPPSVTSSFADALSDAGSTRAVVFLIQGENFVVHATVPPRKSYKEDIELLLPSLPTKTTCASFAYRTDQRSGGGWEWYLITYVPDDAGVRQKMLQASSKAGLLKALGEGRFKESMFFTSPQDLTPKAFSEHLSHLEAPPPLTASEAMLAQIKIDEANEANRAASEVVGRGSQNDRARAGLSGVKGVGLKMGDDVVNALKSLVGGGNGQGRAVMLHIDPPTETLTLQLVESVQPSGLAGKLPTKEPCYTFYAWPGAATTTGTPATASKPEEAAEGGAEKDEDVGPKDVTSDGTSPPPSTAAASPTSPSTAASRKILFIYTCPSSSPVRHRMLYSSALRGVMKDAEDKSGIKVEKKLETSDIEDLTESYLKSELHTSPTPPNRPSSTGPISFGGGNTGGRQFPLPQRSATTSSAASGVSDAPSIASSGGSLPDSAFAMFGPRVGSPSGGGGFARPKPAGRR